MKRISDEEIFDSFGYHQSVSYREGWVTSRDRRIAQAQLEADLRDAENMVEITPEEAQMIINDIAFLIIEHCASDCECDDCKVSRSVITKLKPIAERYEKENS